MTPLQAGQMVGPYQIINQIGMGGMATVYRAYHPEMDRYVAIKVLSYQFAMSEEFLGRFKQEARVIARLEHPHILPVYDVGESNGLPYLVMRYMDAGTLSDRMKTGPLTLDEVDRWFTQFADALAYAHERGVIHRDIKPSNALLDSHGNLFLTDFGIAKLLEGSSKFTATGAITGTPSYMSPEQATGEKVDQRSDIFSLGIVLYEMLAGQVPFNAETPLAVIIRLVQEPLPPPSTINPHIPPPLERVVLKALAKTPADRYPTVRLFAEAWVHALAEVRAAHTDLSFVSKPVAPQSAPPRNTPLPGPHPTPPPAVPAQSPHPTPPPAVPPRAEARPVTLPPTLPPESPVPVPSAVKPRASRTPLFIGGALLLLVCLIGAIVVGIMLNNARKPAQGLARFIPDMKIPSGWTYYPAANHITGVAANGEEILALGHSGLALWSPPFKEPHLLNMTNGLPGQYALAALPLADDLWVGTENGLLRLNAKGGTVYHIDQGLDSSYITSLAFYHDTVWAGTGYAGEDGKGLQRFNGTRWNSLEGFPSTYDEYPDTLSCNVHALLADREDNLWVGTESGLGRFDGETWTLYSIDNGLPMDNITSLSLAADGALLVGTEAGPAVFNGDAFAPLPGYGEQFAGPLSGFIQTPDGHFWMAADNMLLEMNPEEGSWQPYSMETTGLPAEGPYRSLAVDAQGRVLTGTPYGVMAYEKGAFSMIAAPNLPSVTSARIILPSPDRQSLIFARYYDVQASRLNRQTKTWENAAFPTCCPFIMHWAADGAIWAVSWDGAWVNKDGEIRAYTTADGLPSNMVLAVTSVPDGTIYLATDNGMVSFDGSSFTPIEGGPEEAALLFASSDGALWAGQGQLWRRSPEGEWTVFEAGSPFGEFFLQVNALAEAPDGSLWAATANSGLWRYFNGEWTAFPAPRDDYGAESILITVAAASDGSIWTAGNDNGAARFYKNEWTFYSTKNGLPADAVLALYADPDGVIWFAFEGSIASFKP